MSADDSPLWLGMDLSTQSLTLVVLPDAPGAEDVYIDSVQYMTALPEYMTEHGMHVSDGDHGEKVGVGQFGAGGIPTWVARATSS